MRTNRRWLPEPAFVDLDNVRDRRLTLVKQAVADAYTWMPKRWGLFTDSGNEIAVPGYVIALIVNPEKIIELRKFSDEADALTALEMLANGVGPAHVQNHEF